MTERLACVFVALLAASAVHAAQIGYPSTDAQETNWSNEAATACSSANCYASIGSGQQDNTLYIYGPAIGTGSSDPYEAAAQTLTTPGAGTSYIYYSDYQVEAGGGGSPTCPITAYVYEDTTASGTGDTLRHTCAATTPVKNIFTPRTCTISSFDSTPSDWSKLFIRFVYSYTAGGKTCSIRVGYARLEIPNADGGTTTMVL